MVLINVDDDVDDDGGEDDNGDGDNDDDDGDDDGGDDKDEDDDDDEDEDDDDDEEDDDVEDEEEDEHEEDDDERKMMMHTLSEEEEDDKRIEDVEEEDRSQDREAHFVRACAVEMHTDISQEAILYGNLQEKWLRTPPGTSFLASLRSRNAHGHFTRAILCGNLQGKCRTRIPRHPCEPSQSKCTWACHKKHFARENAGRFRYHLD